MISIEFPASQPRTTCHDDEFGYTAALPEAWFVDTTDATQSAGACQVFGPGRFTQYPDNNAHLVYVARDGSLGDPSPYRVVAEHSEIIDGSSATATEVEYTTQYGYKHAGELLYRWMFDGHQFALVVPGGGPSALYDTLKAGAGEIARRLRFD